MSINFSEKSTLPRLHVAVIMDGNGRWAVSRRLPRVAGHRQGYLAVERTVTEAARLGIGTLTLYAFSADNWRRPAAEVTSLMSLFRSALTRQVDRCLANGIRLSVIGRRDRLEPRLVDRIQQAERATAAGQRLHLRLAVDYSSRESILRAMSLAGDAPATRDSFSRFLAEAEHCPVPPPPVDLLIRTGGERRLSDFLLWESAYAELLFLDTMWPDFNASSLCDAVTWFQLRDRRFGALTRTA